MPLSSPSSLLALALTLSSSSANPLNSLSKVFSNKHEALISPHHKDNKWLIFPHQQELHAQSAHGDLRGTDEIVSAETFFQDHPSTLGLDQTAHFKKSRQFTSNGGAITHLKYEQTVSNIPVYGGTFHLTVGSHDGVMTAHGFPLKVINMENHDVEKAQRLNIQGINAKVEADLLAIAKQYILTSYNSKAKEKLKFDGDLKASQPTKVVWTRTGKTSSSGTPASLAYHLNAMASNPFGSFDVFIDISSHEVVFFVDKTKRTSPFSSPIDTDIDVYDMYLKDYNDDVADDDENPDPDRMTSVTKVFDTDSGTYTFPTSNSEINDLVDYTLYASNMYNSLSNGQLPSWTNKLPFNIEFNLTIANAYFDGDWGIHFGTGFITDDVVVHEWAHAYTDVLSGLIYMGESGAMNEAFSDIFGEGLDLLVSEGSVGENELRSTWPLQCQDHVGVDGVSPAGTDKGFRWSLGENVSSESLEGQLRDMYYPECHFSPGNVNSQYYVCSEYAYDGSGVHSNSGVLNRVFATLTDGGEYEDPNGGDNLVVNGLGLTKTLNLFYQTESVLSEYSQFYDASLALSLTCSNLIGQDIYTPNVLDTNVEVSSEVFTADDCMSVSNAIMGSGLGSTVTHCPNLDCSFLTYLCEFATCSESTLGTANNDIGLAMNDIWDPPCKVGSDTTTSFPATGTAKYARVFQKSDFMESSFVINCIDFGYVSEGKLEATIEIFLDADGGEPDDDMTSLGSVDTTVYNTGYNQYSIASVYIPVEVSLSGTETLVVVLSHSINDSPEKFYPAGYYLQHTGTDRTFVGGSCITGYESYSDYCAANGCFTESSNFLLQITPSKVSDDDDGVCFHVDTRINYKGVEYTYEELLAGKEPECTVPHSPTSRGVVISTNCGKTIRVTDTHLLSTSKGFQLAYSLKQGDVLFAGYDDREMCTVTSVRKELLPQKYFGLNCIHSEVLASGLRASTFGDFHTLSSWYMTYVGSVMGMQKASQFGDYVAEWYYSK